jgi:DNA-binding response OmpR family regulator
VVEDDEHIALAIGMCLEMAGYRVETAVDEAIAIITAEKCRTGGRIHLLK